MPDLALTVKQAAKELKRSERTVRRLAASGRLSARKVVRDGNRVEWRISADSVRQVAADFVADTAAATGRGQAAALAAEVRSLREEQRQTAELIAARLEKVERALLALPPARAERPRPWWRRLWPWNWA